MTERPLRTGGFRFDRFRLDLSDRRLLREGLPVELNARYLDALALLVGEGGRLVSKDRFHQEVWRGVPVTDEALTQCIKTLRRQLGDDAAHPRFIETVPKHGYRFIAPVEPLGNDVGSPGDPPAPSGSTAGPWQRFLSIGGAGTAGAGVAGLAGGLLYGFGAAAQPLAPGMGAVSVLLVLVCLALLIALLGGAGVAFGIAAAGFARERRWLWTVLGGAAGGLLVGAVAKLLGLDAFNLLFGRAPHGITGALEGALLGAAVGIGAALTASGARSLGRGIAIAAAAGGIGGMLIPLLGGRLMAGSLDLIARHFPDSRLRLDQVGALFGEPAFGPISQTATGALEGVLFSACIVGAMLLARRRLGDTA